MNSVLRSCLQALLLCFLAAIPALAQVANNTSIVGTVTDQNGQSVAGAKVSAVNTATNDTYNGTTNEEGFYSIDFIREGLYTVTIEMSGFSKAIQRGVVVEINKTVRTDVSLRVGSITESLTVDAAIPPIATDDASLSETINS